MTLTPARAWMSWSSGKDCTFALRAARRDSSLEVAGLLTTVSAEADRVAMHAVRRELVEAQADRLGLPLHVVELPWPCPNEAYERLMAEAMATARAEGVDRVLFGDLFLSDVRAYREQALEGSGVTPMFPLWQRPTDRVAQEMIGAGIRAVLTCVDPAQMPEELVGRQFDERLLAELPESVDPCGENGEFHTFVWDGPGFASPIGIEVGDVVERDGFVFCDVRPSG